MLTRNNTAEINVIWNLLSVKNLLEIVLFQTFCFVLFFFCRLTWKERDEILPLTSNSPQEKFEKENSVRANYSQLRQNANELSDSSWYQLCTKFQQGTRLSI